MHIEKKKNQRAKQKIKECYQNDEDYKKATIERVKQKIMVRYNYD